MNILAIDGESVHPWGYYLLQASDGSRIYGGHRLKTRECFQFLLRFKNIDRVFGYGIGYDVCHWIADLEDSEKMRLAKTGRCYTLQGATFYRVRYVPSVLFEVSELAGCPFNEKGKKAVATVQVIDLMRWHRKPFVDVAEEWGTLGHRREFIKGMKELRGQFGPNEVATVLEYCKMECEATQGLAEQMLVRLKDIGVPACHPFTSGSVAGHLAAKHRVHDYRQEPPAEVSEAVQRAFYGGREQCSRYGHFRDAVQWDLRSAYGWAMMELPDLLGTWYRGNTKDGYRYPIGQWALLKVSWDLDEGRYPVMPFPHRDEKGYIHYPPRGTGWYWSPVVRAALKHYQGDIRILDAWHYVPKTLAKPFSYIGDLYDIRRELGNDPTEGLVKLLIVSTWGRMCSEGSWKKSKPSPTRNTVDWAGMTTALIHERMLDAINQTGQDQFISCCVDGFWTTSPTSPYFPTEYDDQSIGNWSMKRADELFLVRPTVYWKRDGNEWEARTSGFSGIEAEAALSLWNKKGMHGKMQHSERRCKGLLSSAVSEDFSQMGEFYDLQSSISLNPGFGRMGHSCPTLRDGDTWNRWLPYWPPVADRDTESYPFKSRAGGFDNRWKEAAEGAAIEEVLE